MFLHLQFLAFSGFSDVVPFEPLEVQTCLLQPSILNDIRCARLACSWCYLVSITSSLSALDFSLESLLCILWESLGTLAWCVLEFLWYAFLAHSRRSLARLTSSLLIKAILSGRYQMTSRTAWYLPSCLGEGGFLTFFLHLFLKNCLAFSRLSQNLAWFLYLPAVFIVVVMPSNCLTGSVGWKSCLTSIIFWTGLCYWSCNW